MRRSLLRLTRLYKAASHAQLLVLHECTREGIIFGYSRSQTAPNGYHARYAMIEVEIKHRQSRAHRKTRESTVEPI